MTCSTCGGRGFIQTVNLNVNGPCPVCRPPVRVVPEQQGAAREDEKVRILRTVTTHEIPVDRVLASAMDAGLETCIVIGRLPSGEFWFSSSLADGGDVLWELERAKHKLLVIGGAI